MDILLDTHILLWHLEGDSRLKPERSAMIEDLQNRILVNKACLWEIAIKRSIGKLPKGLSLNAMTPAPMVLLFIQLNHLQQVEILPLHHRDPFDRLFIAQAIVEDFFVMTDDTHFQSYPIKLI